LADEGQLVEAVEYYKQVWIQIGAFHPSEEKEREFVRDLGRAAASAGSRLIPMPSSRLIPMAGERVIDDAIVGRVALGITFAAFELTDPKADGA
jgi:hypothetical protein